MDPWAQFPDAPRPNDKDEWDQFPDAAATAAPASSVASEFAMQEPVPAAAAAPVQDTFGDNAIRASAGVLGAPIDAMSEVLELIGAPTSDTPFMGSKSIEGIMRSASGERESREIAAAAPGITQDGGAPLGERLYESFLNTPEATELFLAKKYGPEGQGWYRLADHFGNPTERYVTRAPEDAENAVQPAGHRSRRHCWHGWQCT